ncbi:hypothetical protein [uncultured Acetatifactor sp.]|uniref:hypothetical protein n=1 Tax=uncultured Acetatifactor sp. TaxID=1671927 RepID=UPI002634D077|nr:hypothetical protein [uncultured Acetatifactor sp.]
MGRVLPILFNQEMVRAILDGRKTATRRLIKIRYRSEECNFQVVKNISTGERRIDTIDADGFTCRTAIEPPYRPGDILYVRETWNINNLFSENDEEFYVIYEYKVDGFSKTVKISEELYDNYEESMGYRPEWHPSIHMPKQAARIWLKVTDVRVEQLQEIDGCGVLAEGIDNGKSNSSMGKRWENMQRMAFSELWDSAIKKADLERYGWCACPWVWAIEFERCEKSESEGR